MSISPGAPQSGGRVLVVDDDTMLASQIARVLARGGFHPLVCTEPERALDAVDRFAPHVALVDLHLGDMHGHELASALRARSQGPLHLVALTGDDHARAHARSAALGFAAHLVKPVLLRDLLRVVHVLTIQSRPSKVA
jgi:DNA-binding response OmpR family regulator